MKIVFLGGMVNNLYIMARVLNDQGIQAYFIRDIEDDFIPHQPVWVDNRLSLPPDQLWTKSFDECLSLDKRINWQAPEWYINPLEKNNTTPIPDFTGKNSIIRYLFKRRYERSPNWDKILGLLQTFDHIFTCGFSPAILAKLSGKPYTAIFYGADVETLLRLDTSPSLRNLKDYAYHNVTRALLEESYRTAQQVLSGNNLDLFTNASVKSQSLFPPVPKKRRERVYSLFSSRIWPFPALYHRIKSFPARQSVLPKDKKNKVVVFIPSRIDFFWKGHDKLLSALVSLSQKHLESFHFISPAWGNDVKKFLLELQKRNLEKNIEVLEVMLSRPVLHDYMNESDLIIDNLNFSAYGTATFEAMSLGKPVLMHLDNQNAGPEVSPPVLSCKSSQEIAEVLQKIAEKEIDLKKVGMETLHWVEKYHSNKVFLDYMMQCL